MTTGIEELWRRRFNFNPDILKDYYGRDLRQLSDLEVRYAYQRFYGRSKKSKLSKLAWTNIVTEFARRMNKGVTND